MARAWIGTSGFGYKEWRPNFYPAKMAEGAFLEYYAAQLNAVEIDYTFYRMPNSNTLAGWVESTPDDFRFALKASQKITHREQLKLPSSALEYLLSKLPELGARLGVLLYQLPPYLRRDHERLETFLANLPAGIPIAFEFRNPSWLVDETFLLLAQRGAALCINDTDEGTTPLEVTAPHTYLRLRKMEYTPDELATWQERIRDWVCTGVDVYAFIKHEDNPNAPLIALELAKGLAVLQSER